MKSKGTVGTSLTKVKEAILFRRFLGASVVGMAIFVLAFTVVPYLIAEANATTQLANATVDWSAATLTLNPDYGNTGSGDVEFGSIIPTSKVENTSYGSLRVVKKTIGVATSGKYYAVYLSTNGTTTGLNLVTSGSGDSATVDSQTNIPAVTNTIDSPTTFMTRYNRGWGYNVPNAGTDGNVDGASDFNGSTALVTGETITAASTETSAATTYTASLWAGVGNVDNPQQIWSATTNNVYGFGTYISPTSGTSVTGNTTDDHFDIYYGVAVDTDVLSGTYQNKVLYTALASSDALDVVSDNLLRSSDEFVAGGDTLTIQFDLTDSVANILETSDFTVKLIPHGALYNSSTSSFDYDKTGEQLAAITGAQTCAVKANSLAIADGTSTTRSSLQCTLPSVDPEDGSGNASYDIWVSVPRYGINYLSHYDYEYNSTTYDVATLTYAGLQSYWPNTGTTYGAAATYTDPRFTENTTLYGATNGKVAYYMQDMTANICRNTNKWGTTLGTDAKIYDYTGAGTELATGAAADELMLGTFALADSRDNKLYLVRRLADGNCWMVQNLDLELADFAGKNATNGGLTPANTDLRSEEAVARGYWDPSASANAQIAAYSTHQAWQDASLGNDFRDLAKYTLGYNHANGQQFQPYNLAGGSHYWGTKCQPVYTDSVITGYNCDASAVTNNDTYHSELPRSYSNTIPDDPSTTGTNETQYRYVATNWATGLSTSQSTTDVAQGSNGEYYPTSTNPTSAFGTSATTAVTSTNAFVPTAKASSNSEYNADAGATYQTNADGTYYGNMYIGHYYDWYAAMAESGDYNNTKTREDSICPKGWQLPVSASWTSTTSRSYGNLVGKVYGVMGANGDQADNTAPQGTKYGPSVDMHKLPLSIPFTGYYYWQSGNLYNRGTNGYFWSSTPSSKTNAYNLSFSRTYVYPQDGNNKVNGLTVRCVAR